MKKAAKMTNNKAIILLSGGLDSVVSLSEATKKYNIEYALTFDYGQKALKQELKASEDISIYYNIKYNIIKLDWLKKLLYSNKDWVPNRNGVFINIAAAFAEKNEIDNVIIGINQEEGIDFKDNTKEFLEAINQELKHSTQNEVKIIAPLINKNKKEIVKIGIENNIPFEKIYSCYSGNNKHCGECMSCKFLKNALSENNRQDLINKLF